MWYHKHMDTLGIGNRPHDLVQRIRIVHGQRRCGIRPGQLVEQLLHAPGRRKNGVELGDANGSFGDIRLSADISDAKLEIVAVRFITAHS